MRKIILMLFSLVALQMQAQENRNEVLEKAEQNGWEYEIRAGFNIGGTSPLPLPEEIRHIDHYSPGLLFTLEGNIIKWFGAEKRWGIVTGIRLENKGMETRADVKNYSMEIIGDDGNSLKGNWTGGVRTKVHNSYLTVPVLAAYKSSRRIEWKAGLYFSYLLDGDFSGNVYEGYLRKDNPTGDKVNFNNGAIATYDFSDELRRLQWGVQAGVDWWAFKHLKVFGDLTWGMNEIFKSDFNTITFGLYPIYLNAGFGYVF